MIVVSLLYIVFLVLGVMWFVAWISMPFKLDRVNRNLTEIIELLRDQNGAKKTPKRPRGSDL